MPKGAWVAKPTRVFCATPAEVVRNTPKKFGLNISDQLKRNVYELQPS